jgi:small subunit ribosomal protein S11
MEEETVNTAPAATEPANEPKVEKAEEAPATEPAAEQSEKPAEKSAEADKPASADKKPVDIMAALESSEPSKPVSRPVQSKKSGKGRRGKKAAVKNVSSGKAFIQATYNNTIVTLTDLNGNVLGWSSAGVCGFRGPKKSTPYAAGVIVKDVCDKVRETGLREVSVFVRGIGSGREAAVRALHANGLNVAQIKDVTPIPHNGCRAPKPRRI